MDRRAQSGGCGAVLDRRAPGDLFLLALPVFFMSFDQAFPFGSLTLKSFFLATLGLELARRKRTPGEGGTDPVMLPASEGSR